MNQFFIQIASSVCYLKLQSLCLLRAINISIAPYSITTMNIFGKSSYPALQEVHEPIAPEQLEILKNQLESEHPPSPQSLFNYAWGLLKTDGLRSQKAALEILSTLYRDVPSLRREALYYLALGSVKVGEFTNARRYAESLLEKEPDNAQFKALKEAIDDQVTQDGLIGLGVAGGIIAVGLGVMGALMRRKR